MVHFTLPCLTFRHLLLLPDRHHTNLTVLKNLGSRGWVKYCAGDKIEKNEMGGVFGTYGGRERCAQGFGVETCGKETIGEAKT